MWRPRGGASRLTWRRLGVLLEHLPPESATKTAVRDELDPAELAEIAARPRNRYGSWSHLELLVGQVIDHLAYVAYAVYVAGGGKPQLPTPYPRPGVDTGTRRPDPRAVAYLQNLLDRHAEAHQPKGA